MVSPSYSSAILAPPLKIIFEKAIKRMREIKCHLKEILQFRGILFYFILLLLVIKRQTCLTAGDMVYPKNAEKFNPRK